MNIDEIQEQEDSCRKSGTLKREEKASYPSLVTMQMRRYEKEMVHKLPNELRWALTDYNHRSMDSSIDGDDYNFS